MTQFDEREQAFERQYELEEERNFRVVAHATKELGRWAAEKMGMTGEAVVAYIASALEADMETAHHLRLLSKVSDDFVEKGVRVSPREIGRVYEAFLTRFRKEMLESEDVECVG